MREYHVMVGLDAIQHIQARQVFDSRGDPTIEVEVHCAGGASGRAIVPSGASTGQHEAMELRDGDSTCFKGKGVLGAVANVHDVLRPHLLGMPAADQRIVDRRLCELDGTENKSRLGANALLGVSLACAHAAAAARRMPLWRHLDHEGKARLPFPMVNMISGGLHAGGNLDFQDFLLLPIGARSFSDALAMSVQVYRWLSATLIRHGFEGVLVGDEGGFGPRLRDNEQAVEMIVEAIKAAGFTPGRDAALAIDLASSHFFQEGKYHLKATAGMSLSPDALTQLLSKWADTYPILSIEDGMAEDDWDGWKHLTKIMGQRVQLIGDDLFVTNRERLERGIRAGIANCVLVKLNQIGTLTETLDLIVQARAAGYRCVISARSGESEDTTISDLAVATGAGQIKIGSIARGERLAKYNQLLRIEEALGQDACFAKWPIA
jgi:enolase